LEERIRTRWGRVGVDGGIVGYLGGLSIIPCRLIEAVVIARSRPGAASRAPTGDLFARVRDNFGRVIEVAN